MVTSMPVLCTSCKRLKAGGLTCTAFPQRIPPKIVTFGADHRVPIEGDQGLQYMPDPKKEPLLRQWQNVHR
jgi:hypothetical protein